MCSPKKCPETPNLTCFNKFLASMTLKFDNDLETVGATSSTVGIYINVVKYHGNQ